MSQPSRRLFTLLALACFLVGCAAPAATTPPTAPGSPTPLPAPAVTHTATTAPATATATAAASPRPAVDPAVLDNYLLNVEKLGLFSGTVLVARDGQVLLDKGYGPANAAQNVPNGPKTKFLIGSMTKQFTAMAILMLEAQGKVHVPDSICTYLADCPALWQPITLQELLTHSSGITNYTSVDGVMSIAFTPSPLTQTLQLFRDVPLDFTPGTQFEYSNSNYFLLGMVIERVTGQNYGDFLQAHIFGPLGMTDTGTSPLPPDLAVGYFGGKLAKLADPSIYFSAGMVYSTVDDLYLWDQALYTERLLPRATMDRMFSAQIQTPLPGASYGYGWFTQRDQGHLVIFHGGDTFGFASEIARYVDDHLTIIVLSNRQDAVPATIRQALATKALGE